MKATKLMIGDWVFCEHNKRPEQVQAIYEDVVMLDYNDFYPYDEIEQIPLTPEILEKNGFKKDGESYFFAHDFYDIEISEVSDSNWLVVLTDCEFNLPHNQVFASHVHDLQNALRIFGTDEAIEL